MSSGIRDYPDRRRFELDVNGLVAFATYRRQDKALAITHVEAPLPLRGTGTAGRLMQGIVDHARAEGLKIVPLCGYAAAWMRRHKRVRMAVYNEGKLSDGPFRLQRYPRSRAALRQALSSPRWR